jgi:Na+/H+ antiporter NhaD/arsenite permease-like protein
MKSIKLHKGILRFLLILTLLMLLPVTLHAAPLFSQQALFGIRYEFIVFALVLVGVALFSKKSMQIAVAGLLVIVSIKLFFIPEFSFLEHFFGTAISKGEWKSLLNLAGLLFGFAILARHFEESKLSDILPDYLPNDWKGGFVLLCFVMVLATFLDSIASAMIGGAIAFVVFKGRVHIGYLVAIVAASNGGGAGSVLGNMPTTMMWIDGVSPLDVTRAFIGSIFALLIFGVFASIQQDKFQRIQRDASKNVKIDWGRLSIVILILVLAVVSNWVFEFPALGVWVGIALGAIFRKTSWKEIPKSLEGTIFLVALVASASLMPVNDLPPASWQSAFSMGFVSAVFDNIPLTKLCLVQGGYDWGILAFTIGFGGSMIWFGSSAGVAITNMYPEAKSVVNYVKKGWHVSLAYVISFFIMLSIVGWQPMPNHHKPHADTVVDVNDSIKKLQLNKLKEPIQVNYQK